MLSFIQKATTSNHRTPIRYYPEKTYGNSFEAPSEFHTSHSIVDHHSYRNPFLSYGSATPGQPSERQARSVEPRWTKKTNLSNLQTSKMQGPDSDLGEGGKQGGMKGGEATHRERYHREITSDPLRFRLTKGEFTEFLNKNHHYRSVGPLQGVERSPLRIELTRSALRQQQQTRVQQLTISNRFESELYNTIKSNLAKNSSLLTHRNRIKKNREVIRNNFRRDIESRRQNTSYSFNLPHLPYQQAFLQQQMQQTHTSRRRYKTEQSEHKQVIDGFE